jgi:hypothetical protein
MAEQDDETRYFRIPATPKELGDWDFTLWWNWYIEREERLKANHARGRALMRLGDAVEGLKPAMPEVDAIKEAEEKIARLQVELAATEKQLKQLKSGPPPKPTPARAGDICELRDADWQLVVGFLTDEKEAPKCGYAPVDYIQAGKEVIPRPFPVRPVLKHYIGALRGATLTKPEEPKEESPAEQSPAAPAEETAAE